MNDRKKFLLYVEDKFKDIKYGEKSYVYHLLSVEKVAEKYLKKYVRFNAISLACLGHDLLEDTDATVEELRLYISGDIIDIIEKVTDKEGKNRRERHLNTYAYIRESEEAVIVKLCDRIANIEESLSNNDDSKKSMYKKEFKTFKSALYDPRHQTSQKLWEYYDSLYEKIL